MSIRRFRIELSALFLLHLHHYCNAALFTEKIETLKVFHPFTHKIPAMIMTAPIIVAKTVFIGYTLLVTACYL